MYYYNNRSCSYIVQKRCVALLSSKGALLLTDSAGNLAFADSRPPRAQAWSWCGDARVGVLRSAKPKRATPPKVHHPRQARQACKLTGRSHPEAVGRLLFTRHAESAKRTADSDWIHAISTGAKRN